MRHPAILTTNKKLVEVTKTLSPNADVELPEGTKRELYKNPYSASLDSTVSQLFDKAARDSISELYRTSTDFNNDLHTVNTFYSIHTTSGAFNGEDRIKKICTAFQAEIQKLISSGRSFVFFLNKFERLTKDTMNETSCSFILNCINGLLQGIQEMPAGALKNQARADFERYKVIINDLFNAKAKISDFLEVFKDLYAGMIGFIDKYCVNNASKATLLEVAILKNKFCKIILLMNTQSYILKYFDNILHNFENAIIDLKVSIHSMNQLPNFISYFKDNRELITIQIGLLTYFEAATVNQVIKLWPLLNIEIGRAQSKATQLLPAMLITQKKDELARLSEKDANYLIQFAETIKVCNISEPTALELALLIQFLDLDIIKQNALIKFLVLERIILFYSLRNYKEQTTAERDNSVNAQIKYLDSFVENLLATKDLWNGIMFKNINEFVYIQKRLQNVIAATELAFLNCENLFRSARVNDLDLKNAIIQKQLQLLKMQNEILNFTLVTGGQEFVLHFYFRKPFLQGFVFYEVLHRNRELYRKGDWHNIIKGIPIIDIFDRNALFCLRLETLQLEFVAMLRVPQDNDYYNAISDTEIEQYLTLWEKEDEAEKARKSKHETEEMEHKAQKKKQENKQKLAAKKAERPAVKCKESTKDVKPAILPTKSAPEPSKDKLVLMLDNLLLKLKPGNFNAEAIHLVVGNLYPLTQSTKNVEVAFQALSTMGDCYAMIAGRYLNFKKHPKQLIVNLKLSINYYKQAELTLRKLDKISQDQHMHYYSWLYNSLNIQQRLLGQYTEKFTKLRTRLFNDRERVKQKDPKQWKENCYQDGWKESDKTATRLALEDALEAVSLMQKENAELAELTKCKAKANESDAALTYTFENYLHSSGKIQVAEPALNYTLDEGECMAGTELEKPANPTAKKPVAQTKQPAIVIRILSRTPKQPAPVNPLVTTAVQQNYANTAPIVFFTRPANPELCISSQISLTISSIIKDVFNMLDLFLEYVRESTTEELRTNKYFKPVNNAIKIARAIINDLNTSDFSAFLNKLAKIISCTNGFDNWLLRNQYFPEECLMIVHKKLIHFTPQSLANCIWALDTFGINNLSLLTDLYSHLISKGNQQNLRTSTSLSAQFSLENMRTLDVSCTQTSLLWQTMIDSGTNVKDEMIPERRF